MQLHQQDIAAAGRQDKVNVEQIKSALLSRLNEPNRGGAGYVLTDGWGEVAKQQECWA